MSHRRFVDQITVKELKMYLRQSNLPVSGNKAELQERLDNHMQAAGTTSATEVRHKYKTLFIHTSLF